MQYAFQRLDNEEFVRNLNITFSNLIELGKTNDGPLLE